MGRTMNSPHPARPDRTGKPEEAGQERTARRKGEPFPDFAAATVPDRFRRSACAADPLARDPFALDQAGVHEAGGRGRRIFALFQAARHPGPLVWILPGHISEAPFLPGLPAGVGARLLLLRPRSEVDLLWCCEETLRAAPVSLVIAEPQGPLSLTAGRRLQLAAGAGGTTGLLLIRDGQGSNAARTRWHCEPLPSARADSTLHRWEIIKNKTGTLRSWVLDWDGSAAAFHVVPEACERREPAGPPR